VCPDTRTGKRSFSIETRHLVQVGEGSGPARRPLLLALHGQGMSADGLLRLLDFPSRAERLLLVPEGPYPFERRRKGERAIGHAWYLYRGDQDEFRCYLERSEEHVLGVLEDVRKTHPYDADRLVLLGFSQGGYLAGFMALRNKRLFRGLVLASTRLKHEFLANELATGELPPTLVLHGRNDASVRWEAASESIGMLERAGASVEIQLHEEGHRLPAGFGAQLEAWLRRHDL
jgi:phospholipase/carboxylesterase